MALVRCAKHNIPYNNQNPRGCPACAHEKRGSGDRDVMDELRRARHPRQTIDEMFALEEAPPPPKPDPKKKRSRIIVAGSAGAVLLVVLLVSLLGPKFDSQPDPPPIPSNPRPTSIFPGQPMVVAFSHLGAQGPQPHPSDPSVERYVFESVIIDAIGDSIYALTFVDGNRSWQGLTIGMSETSTRGAAALLGTTTEDSTGVTGPTRVGRYLVYPSLVRRARRVLTAGVRPPNGCYDIVTTLRPRALGTVTDGGLQFAAVARRGSAMEWVLTDLLVVSRSVNGPLSSVPVCRQ